MFKQKLQYEIFALILLAVFLGFIYTFITKKGFFAITDSKQIVLQYEPKIISLETAKDFFESNSGVFIDSRHQIDYSLGHIKGAINIPLKEFDTSKNMLDRISKKQPLIIYCDGEGCNSSLELAIKIIQMGFSNVNVFIGGWQVWRNANLPSERKHV